MKRIMLLISGLVILTNLQAQEKSSEASLITSSGGPEIRVQKLNGLNGIFIGGGGCFGLNDWINLTAQGVILVNGINYSGNEMNTGYQAENLQSGYGGFGFQVKTITVNNIKIYLETNLFAGGYSFESGSDIFFWSNEWGVRLKYNVNQFVSLTGGLSVPFYSIKASAYNEVYKTYPILSFSIEFGKNR